MHHYWSIVKITASYECTEITFVLLQQRLFTALFVLVRCTAKNKSQHQGKISTKVTGMTGIRNTLWVPLTTIIPTGRCILLRQSKPRSLTESVP